MLAATGEPALALRCALLMLAGSSSFVAAAGSVPTSPLDLLVESLGGATKAGGTYLAASGTSITIGQYKTFATVSQRDYEQTDNVGLGAWGGRGILALDLYLQKTTGDAAGDIVTRVNNLAGAIIADLQAMRGGAIPGGAYTGGAKAFYRFWCKADGLRVLDDTGELADFAETTILLSWSSP